MEARSSEQVPLAKTNISSVEESHETPNEKYIRGYVPYGALQVKMVQNFVGRIFTWKMTELPFRLRDKGAP